jgi:hypothetical protein
VTIAFQLALAAGAPWGTLTWGGRFPGRLPTTMRAVAMFSALLLSAFGAIVAGRGELLPAGWVPQSGTWIWLVVAYCAVGVLANATTPSTWERRVWLPIVLGMLGSSLVVALTA